MVHSSDRIAKQYVLEKEIGKSKSSQVFSAFDEKGKRRVAIKIINHASIINKERLFQVTQTLAQINHPNILRVYSVGEVDDGGTYIVSELLDGFLLNAMVPKDEGIAFSEAWPIIFQIASGLNAAHSAGLLHLDIKPSNIFVTHDKNSNEVFKIIDFGISQFISEQTEKEAIGTPGYIAPELITGSAGPSVQSDIYGLGALLAFLLLGRRPFEGVSTQEVLQNQLKGEIIKVPFESVQNLIQVSTNADPQKRHISIKAFLNTLSDLHRDVLLSTDQVTNISDEPNENVTEFALGRLMIVSIILTVLSLSLLLYFWLVTGI